MTRSTTATDSLTVDDRIALADKAYREGRIIQNAWRKQNGKELVCALAAFGPDINGSEDCPAELMPEWMAQLVPTLDDGIDAADVPWFMGGLLDAARQFRSFDEAQWERVRTGFLIRTIQIAADEAANVQPDPAPDYWTQCLAAIKQVQSALAGNGDLSAASAAWSAAESAGSAAWSAASAARSVAWSAARSAARSVAWSAARSAARSAASAARSAAESAGSAAESAASAARSVASAARSAASAWSAESAANAAYRRIAEALFQIIAAEAE